MPLVQEEAPHRHLVSSDHLGGVNAQSFLTGYSDAHRGVETSDIPHPDQRRLLHVPHLDQAVITAAEDPCFVGLHTLDGTGMLEVIFL